MRQAPGAEWARKTAILFDVDGTLYRQTPLRRAMALRLLRESAVRPRSALTIWRVLRAYRRAHETLRETRGEGGGRALSDAQLRLASESSGLAPGLVLEVVTRWMEREPLAFLPDVVQANLRDFLVEARTRGMRLGVFSDYPAKAKLEAMGLHPFFEAVVSAQDAEVNRLKPDPQGLIEVLRRLRAAPEEALYVGDRHDVDAEAARGAGISCIIVGGRSSTKPAAGVVRVSGYAELGAMLFSTPSQSLA